MNSQAKLQKLGSMDKVKEIQAKVESHSKKKIKESVSQKTQNDIFKRQKRSQDNCGIRQY